MASLSLPPFILRRFGEGSLAIRRSLLTKTHRRAKIFGIVRSNVELFFQRCQARCPCQRVHLKRKFDLMSRIFKDWIILSCYQFVEIVHRPASLKFKQGVHMRQGFWTAVLFVMSVTGASAQERTPSHCHALADRSLGMEYVHKASWQDPVAPETVRIQYIAHASFLIQSTGGLNMVTDFTGFVGSARMIPDVVTMNHAHDTHWTAFPDPAIPNVLPGWGPTFGEGIDHSLDLGEVLIRNVSTDIRSRFGSGVEPKGNSVFVFEMAGLCIGHLGHLHHEPTPEQYAAIGRLDVVMAAVDGGSTLDLPTMTRVLTRLRSSVVIPMHWFGELTLGAFLSGMEGTFQVVQVPGSSIEMSMDRLPSRPTIMVLRPEFLQEQE